MKYLSAFLAQFENLESLGQGTAGTAGSPVVAGAPLATVPVTAEPTATPEPEAADQDITPRCCDDCGRTSPVLLITTYGGAYCRECVTFPPKRVPAPRPPTDLEVEQAGKPLLGHSPEGVGVDLKLFGDGGGPKGGAA
jgi:hypothetical protein